MPAHRKELKIEGSNLWYLVGLITTDGCLCSDGRHIDITSKDYSLLQVIKDSAGITNRICIKYNGKKQKYFHIQCGNRNFYEFLLSIGLTPHKSLTIGALKIPNYYFTDFFRGVVDGDGCIRHWIHPSNGREQWSLRVYSGSEKFVKWLCGINLRLLKIKGRIHRNTPSVWALKYGKMATREIAGRCYYEGCLGLDRKIKLAQACFNSRQGWSKSKTVLN